MSRRIVDPPHESAISAHAGDVLEIVLPENATTGYLWHAEEPVPETEVRPALFQPGGDAIGAGGSRVFEVEPKSAGERTLSFVLRRPGDPRIAERRTFRLAVPD